MGRSQLKLAFGVDGNINSIVDAKEQRAGILQAPALIGNGELRVGGKTITRQMGLNNKGKRMA